MPDPAADGPPPEPQHPLCRPVQPIEYRAPKDDPPPPGAGLVAPLLFMVGLAMGGGVTFVAGVMAFQRMYYFVPTNHPAPGLSALAAVTWMVIAACSVVWLKVTVRARRREWLLQGFLVGLGVLALLEGLCFGVRI